MIYIDSWPKSVTSVFEKIVFETKDFLHKNFLDPFGEIVDII